MSQYYPCDPPWGVPPQPLTWKTKNPVPPTSDYTQTNYLYIMYILPHNFSGTIHALP